MKHLLHKLSSLRLLTLLAVLLGMGSSAAWADEVTLWSEDFSSYAASAVPSGGDYSYVVSNGGGTTKIYTDNTGGGTSPELLIGKKANSSSPGGYFQATIPLDNIEGDLTLTFKSNAPKIIVSTTTLGASVKSGSEFSSKETHTSKISVTSSMTSVVIRFTAGSTSNCRLDDIVLKGSPAQAVTPTFSPAAGTYGSAQSVTLSTATDGATIYYTTNGETPTSSSTTYSGAITVSSTQTIKAIAVKDGYADSEVATATYTIATPCATPTFTPAEGTYTSDQSVTISTATGGATIYYTTDGSTPSSSSSTTYSGTITVSSAQTIKAIAVKDGYADSEVASAGYTINKPTPSLSFAAASYDAYLGSSFSAPTLTNTNSVSPITYSSSDIGVATVNESTGAITLVGEGSTTITASFAGNASYTAANAAYTLNVSDPAVATTVTISAIGITNTDVYVSTTAGSFAATVKDNENATIGDASVTWSSSNPDVATINSSTGVVTLVAAGSTTITATYDGVQYSYLASSNTYALTVTSSEPYVQPTSIDITPNYTFWGKDSQFSGSTYDALNGEAENVLLSWSRGTGSTYANTTAMRFYKDNDLTFTAPTGYEIRSIKLTVSGTYSDLTFSPSGYDNETTTWTGSASVVTMSRPSNASSYASISGFAITLTKQKELSSIAVSGSYPTNFEVGDTFSHEGAVVTATYDDASNADVTSSATFSTPDMSSAGTKTITVSYTENAVEKTTTYNITVKTPATFEFIALSGSYPTTFNVGDAFSHEGMTVTANFDDETSTDVTTSATFTGYDMSAAGVQTVTVSYTHKGVTTKTTTYNITVNTVAVTGVTVAPTAASLYVGETTTLTATVSPNNATNKNVTWTSSNESVATVAAGVVTAVAAGTATITVTTEDGSQTDNCEVTVEEVVDYETLPFVWAGGSSASLTALTGVSANSLGTDYAASNTPYLVKLDGSGDYIQIKTDSRPDVVTIGVKMLGGANTSYITVKASTDGETFDEGQQLTISGTSNAELTLTSTRSFAADVRYVRLLFTKGSNVGVGPISISKYIPKYAFTFAANPVAAGTITATYSAEDVTSGDTFAEGTGLSISADANAGYSFSGWTEENDLGTFANASNASTTYTMPGAAAAISANFTVNNYDLSIEEGVNGSYTTTVNGEAWDGSSKIPYGATVSITAVPDDSYVFSSWDATLDAYNTTANPLVFTMPADEVAIEGSFVSAAIEYTIDIDDEVTGGSIEASANSATAGTEITLTPTPASGYQFVSWTVLDGSANEVTVTNNKFTMPGSDVTVSATFKQIFTVTYFVNGVENSVERLDGATLSLDDPAALASMSFAGWSESNNATSPVFVPNSTAITSNKTLYAYFIASSNYTYQLVESEQDDWRGDYLIAYSSSIFADGRTGGTGGIGAQNVSVNPGTNLVGKTVKASWGDTYNVTIEAVDNSDLSNGYVLKTKDEKYNYQTSNTNGLASSENKNTAADYPLSVTFNSSSDIDIANSAGAQFHYNDQGYFRFYKDGGQKSVYLYKKVLTGVNYSLGTTAVTIAQACTDGEKYYGTFSHGSSFIVPADVTVSEIEVSDDRLVVTDYEEGDIVPANTGVMISAEDYGGKSFVLTTAAGEAKTATNALKASGNSGINAGGMATAAPDCVYYRLTMHNGTDFGFYWGAAEGAAFSLAANKAYLAVPKAAGVKEFFTFDNLATAIHSMRTEESNDAIFNLAGQKISRLQKGINIVNGKKIFIK